MIPMQFELLGIRLTTNYIFGSLVSVIGLLTLAYLRTLGHPPSFL